MAIKFTVNFSSERLTGKKARALQREEIELQGSGILYLFLKWQEETNKG